MGRYVGGELLWPWNTLQVALSTGFSRQEYWSGLPRPPPGDLSNPGSSLRVLGLPRHDEDLREPLVRRQGSQAQTVKNLPAMQGTLCQEDTLEKAMATHSNILVLSLAQTHRGRPQTTSTRLYAGGELQRRRLKGSPLFRPEGRDGP